jgi:hypothetical protein
MPRSGSTFSFNIVRCLLEARGTVYQEPTGNILTAVERANGAAHLLCKGHGADEVTLKLAKLGAIKVVCTVRKPEDAIASWMRTFDFTLEQSLGVMENWLWMFNSIRAHALVLPFEEIDREPKSAAWKIARYVCNDVDELAVERIATEFTKAKVKDISEDVEARKGHIQDLGFSFYDKRTFFHRRHVSSVETVEAADRIGTEQVSAIRRALAAWCDGEGNLR